MCTGSDQAPGSVAEAVRAAAASLDYLIQVAAGLPAAACGEALAGLGEVRAKFTVAHAVLLRRFDALNGTIQKALGILKDEGLVHSVQGRGVFVIPRT